MIRAAIELLVDELNRHVRKTDSINTVVAANVAHLESEAANRVVVSLINIREDPALKNTPSRRAAGTLSSEGPPLNLHLDLLVSAQFGHYLTGLDRLSEVIDFFHSTPVFSFGHTPTAADTSESPGEQEVEMLLELLPLGLEEAHGFWGSIGCKQVPFVMYSARLLPRGGGATPE